MELASKVLANPLLKPCHTSLALKLLNLPKIHALVSSIKVLGRIHYIS
jgi:hypothetical protein